MLTCESCGKSTNTLKYLRERSGWCPTCFYATETTVNQSAMIATDSIPGGLEIKHGLCYEDGTPRRFDSKSEIKRAAYDLGYVIAGDTPKSNPHIAEQRAREKEQRQLGIPGLRSR